MATLYSDQITNDRAAPPVRGEFNRNGSPFRIAYATYTMTGNEVAADVVQMVKVGAGDIVHQHLSHIEWTDCGGTITADVGDGDDDDRYCSALALGTASGTTVTTFEEAAGVAVGHALKEYTAADTIDITFDVATTPNTTGVIYMVVVITRNS